jgi:Uma2 family endonuclease
MSQKAGPQVEPENTASSVVGQRRLFYFNENGQPAYRIYELQGDDFLNPQPGDEFTHGELHDQTARILGAMLHHHFRYSPTNSVHIRPKIVWTDETLAQPMPDVAIVSNLADAQVHRPVLNIAEEQTKAATDTDVAVRAIFEVTSPLLAQYDFDEKHTVYERAGVDEYWIIDTGLRPEQGEPHFSVYGYRLVDDHFEPIAPDSAGQWASKACRLWIRVAPDALSIELGDLRTGKTFPVPSADDDPSISAQAEASRRAQSIADQLKL